MTSSWVEIAGPDEAVVRMYARPLPGIGLLVLALPVKEVFDRVLDDSFTEHTPGAGLTFIPSSDTVALLESLKTISF